MKPPRAAPMFVVLLAAATSAAQPAPPATVAVPRASCPEGAHPDQDGTVCRCDDGWERSTTAPGFACLHVCGPHLRRVAGSDACVCAPGWRSSGAVDRCEPAPPAADAGGPDEGHDDEPHTMVCPAHSHPRGEACECDPGFSHGRDSGGCYERRNPSLWQAGIFLGLAVPAAMAVASAAFWGVGEGIYRDPTGVLGGDCSQVFCDDLRRGLVSANDAVANTFVYVGGVAFVTGLAMVIVDLVRPNALVPRVSASRSGVALGASF